jgi:hypothetical protein
MRHYALILTESRSVPWQSSERPEDGDWRVVAKDATVSLQRPTFAGRQFTRPGIFADIEATSRQLSAEMRIATSEGGFAGQVELHHDLDRNTGGLRLADTELDFDTLKLSETMADWTYDLDVSSGQWRIGGDVTWAITDHRFAYTGSTVHTLDSLAGSYGDIGFVGLDSEIGMTLDWQADPSLSPATIEVDLIDIGFPIRDLRSRFTADIDGPAVDVESVAMTALGGTVTVDPFRFDLVADTNELMLRAREIQLPLMVGLADLEAVNISGSVSGDIPVTISNGKITINDGYLENDPPGGVIRYGAAAGVVDEGSQLGIVSRTLSNFEFDVLTSDVNYTDNGDLELQMRLTGINPDVDPNQPVILNLSVENNVPQMLRSLQATRSIEDILEKRLSK